MQVSHHQAGCSLHCQPPARPWQRCTARKCRRSPCSVTVQCSAGRQHVGGRQAHRARQADQVYMTIAPAPVPVQIPHWHSYLGPATLVAALFMTSVALWKLLFATDGPTRLERDLITAVELVDSVKGYKVEQLFKLFDTNQDGKIDFKEVSDAMRKIQPELTLEDARRQAVDVFLLIDDMDEGALDLDDFRNFLRRYSLLTDSPFFLYADDMIEKLQQPDVPRHTSEEEAQRQLEAVGLHQVADLYKARTLDAIFSQWDRNEDGRISFQELCLGLFRFSKVENLKDRAAAAAQAILEPGMEGDSSKNMTREAFGTFMQRFASASGLSFKDLSNFLLVLPRYNFDVDLNDPGVKQLTKLVRKRLEERRREKKLSKLETAEQLKLSEVA